MGARCSVLTFAQVGYIVEAVFDRQEKTPRGLRPARGVDQDGGSGPVRRTGHRYCSPSVLVETDVFVWIMKVSNIRPVCSGPGPASCEVGGSE